MISNCHFLSHSAPIFKNYNLLNVYDTYDLELSTFMYKYHTNQLPKTFNSYFVEQRNHHRYHTRNTEDYKICLTKTEFANKTIRTAGPRKWHSIDKCAKTATSVKLFRSKIKTNLMEMYT